MDLRQGDGEGVGQRQRRRSRLIGKRQAHAGLVESLDAKAEPLKCRAVVVPQLPLVEQVGDGKFPWQAKCRLKQSAAFQIDQDRRI